MSTQVNINPMPATTPPSDSDEIDLLELALTIWRGRRLIAAITLATTALALALALILPRSYTAKATLLPTQGESGGMMSGIAAQLLPSAGMLGLMGGSKSSDLVEILSSRSMAERVISVCQLDRELKGWKTRSQLVAQVMEKVSITPPSLKSAIIVVEAEAPSAELAAKMANAYAKELKVMLDEMGYNSASKNRRFIERQFAKNQAELAKAEEALGKFQSENRIVSLPDTVLASIKSVSELEAQRISAEVQIKSSSDALGVMRSKVAALQADPNVLSQMELKQKELESQRDALVKAQASFTNKLTNLPPKAIEYARLQRDVQVQNAIYMALSQQLEAAMISENKESDAFLPLDAAVPPERHSKPKRTFIVLIGLALGLVGGVLSVFGWDSWRQASSVTKPSEA